MSHALFAKEKIQSCKTLGIDKINIIQSMLSKTPTERPEPSKLLNSELFKGVPTKCALDKEEVEEVEYQETVSQMSEEEEEEDVEHIMASYKNMLDDLKDQVEASNDVVYPVNPMEPHVEAEVEELPNLVADQEKIVEEKHSIDKQQGQVDELQKQVVSEMKCDGCADPVPMYKVLKSGKQVVQQNHLGFPLAWCYLDTFHPKRQPPGCRFFKTAIRGKQTKYGFKCACSFI